jgi:hypothetical protein
MGCPTEVEIGDNLTFSICTHDPDTGALTDAGSTPTYRVYEDVNETVMVGLSGNMDSGTGAGNNEFDDANTTGFYMKQIACTAANGFEEGKSYTIYIEATVDGDKGGICYGFRAIRTKATLNRNADLAASRKGFHTWQGNVYYVDPDNGNDVTGDGTRALPYATLQAAHDDLVTDSNHDVVIMLAKAAGAATIHTTASTTTLSKRYMFVRGPGRDFLFTRTGTGDTISITADGVEISGMQIGTAATGSGNGIQITGADFVRVRNCWVLDTRGDGINILRGSNCQIVDNYFESTGAGGTGQGIHIVGTAGTSDDNAICNNHFADVADDAIYVESGTTNDSDIHHNTIHNSGGWGINIGASSNDAQVYNNILGNNTSGDIQDNGTNSIIKNNTAWSSPAEVNTEVLDVLNVDTFAEPASVPAATATIQAMIHWMYTLSRNEQQRTASLATIRNDGDSGDIATAVIIGNDAVTFTREEWS